MEDDLTARIRHFVEDNFLFREDADGIANDESLLDAGLIDSTGILELVSWIEAEFGVRMADAEIVPENLDTIAAIAAYLGRKRPASLVA